jgi:hypothetical protein
MRRFIDPDERYLTACACCRPFSYLVLGRPQLLKVVLYSSANRHGNPAGIENNTDKC